jgi:hypothetical protein
VDGAAQSFLFVGKGTEDNELLKFLVNGKRKAKLESARDFFFLELSKKRRKSGSIFVLERPAGSHNFEHACWAIHWPREALKQKNDLVLDELTYTALLKCIEKLDKRKMRFLLGVLVLRPLSVREDLPKCHAETPHIRCIVVRLVFYAFRRIPLNRKLFRVAAVVCFRR